MHGFLSSVLPGQGFAEDYYLDAKSQCAGGRGSCPDKNIPRGRNDVRLLNSAIINDFTMLTFRQPLSSRDRYDKNIFTNRSQPIIWAVGPVNNKVSLAVTGLNQTFRNFRASKSSRFEQQEIWQLTEYGVFWLGWGGLGELWWQLLRFSNSDLSKCNLRQTGVQWWPLLFANFFGLSS